MIRFLLLCQQDLVLDKKIVTEEGSREQSPLVMNLEVIFSVFTHLKR